MVTGAGGGLGSAIAIGLAEHGAHVACLDRSGDLVANVVDRVGAAGRMAVAIDADLSSPASLADSVTRLESELGPLQLAVNCAGIHSTAPAEAMDQVMWRRLVEVNLSGVFLSCQAEGRAMLGHGGGSIVNLGSVSGTIANRGLAQVHYNATKAAVAQMSRSLALEWAQREVRVNTVSPGYVRTPMSRAARTSRTYEEYLNDIPMRRMADPAEIVGATVFLLSDAASYCTGAELLVDGGLVSW